MSNVGRGLDDSPEAAWKARFRARAPRAALLAGSRPSRALVVHDTSGVFQLHGWDMETGALRRLTDDPVGVTEGAIDHRGETVYYLHAPDGSEAGHLRAVPWAGGPGRDVTPSWDAYHGYGVVAAAAADVVAFTIAGDDRFRFLVLDGDEGPREIGDLEVGSMTRSVSSDGAVAFVQTFGGAESPDFGVVAFDVATGDRVGVLDDGPGISLEVHVPAPGSDGRIAATTTETGVRRPFLWTPRTGGRTVISVDAEGDVVPVAWSPDSGSLVMTNVVDAHQRLFVAELATGSVREIGISGGTTGPGVGIIGSDEYGFGFDHLGRLVTTHSSFSAAPTITAFDLASRSRIPLLTGGAAPAGRNVRSVTFQSRDGTAIQGWLATPEGRGPTPLVIYTHGGPTMAELDRWSPEGQAWLDHGFAWLSVNYRGSTTFGRDFQMAGIGRVGELEVDDMVAAREWAVRQGIALPDQVFASGWSMGGYLTLQALGTAPGLWAAGLAGIASADFTTQYDDESEELRGLDRQMFGGTPTEMPERYIKASPITYVEQVDAPILVVQGRNDMRCPPRQIEDYERRLRELGKPIEVDWFDAGHFSGDIELQIALVGRMIGFALDILAARAEQAGIRPQPIAWLN